MNRNNTINILEINDIKVKKKFGQNFLHSEDILNKISNATDIENKNVIEIGPGLGFLTGKLITKAKKVICYEIDTEMVEYLSEKFKNHKNIEIVSSDFLKVNLKEEIKEKFNDEKVIIVANLPYYITTAILTKVLEETNKVSTMIVMMQKEVALRITGKPSTKDYNGLSVLIQYFTNAKLLFNVSPNCFYPAPEVESSVVKIDRKETIENPAIDLEFFLKFVRNIFIQRRKTLMNNLQNAYKIEKSIFEEGIKMLNLPLTVRAENLTVEQIVSLSNYIYKHINS